MMKKLLILTAVMMLMSSTVGCRCWNRLFRGSYDRYPSYPAYSSPDPCNPCNQCASQPALTTMPNPIPYPGTPSQ